MHLGVRPQVRAYRSRPHRRTRTASLVLIAALIAGFAHLAAASPGSARHLTKHRVPDEVQSAGPRTHDLRLVRPDAVAKSPGGTRPFDRRDRSVTIGGTPPSGGVDPYVTFSEVPVGSAVTDQYMQEGVIFRGGTMGWSPYTAMIGGTFSCPVLAPGSESDGNRVLRAVFVYGVVDTFSLDVDFVTPGSVEIQILGSGGEPITSNVMTGSHVTTLTSNYSGVTGFVIRPLSVGGGNWYIDNLQFVLVGGPGSGSARGGSELYGQGNPGETGPAPCMSGDPVNCATGNLTETVGDLAVSGRGRTLDLERTYNALDAATASTPGRFGWGWSDSYGSHLTFDPGGGVTVHQENGSTVSFTLSGNGYTAPPRVVATLAHNPDDSYTYTLPDQRADVFTSTGVLRSETDRNGYQTTLTYTGDRLTTVTDPAGRTLTFTYDAGGHVAQVTDPAGRSVHYGYDGADNLTSVTDPASHTTTFGYDASHRMTTMTDPRGATTTNVFDPLNRVTSQTDALNHTLTLSYATTSTTVTDARGNVETQTYDAGAHLISIARGVGTPQAATWSYTYDDAGNRITALDPNGHTWQAAWDARGNEVASSDPLGRITTATYDSSNNVTSATDPMGVETTFTYEAHGNVATVSKPLTSTGEQATTTFTYDPAHPGDVASTTDPEGHSSTVTRDAAGNVTARTDATGNTTTFTYNAIGWPLSTTSPRGNVAGADPSAFTTTMGYDDDGHVTGVTDPLGHTGTAVYDAAGNRTSVTDRNDHTTISTYDLDGELTLVRRPDGSTQGTSYDANGNVASQTDGLGHITTFTYDPLDRQTSSTDPLNRRTSFGYDAAGNRITKRDAAGQTTSYTHDAAGQLTGISYSDGTTPAESFAYDSDGRRTMMTDASGTSTFMWDSLGRLTSTTNGAAMTMAYIYDLTGRIESISYPGSNLVTRQYDDAGRMTAVSDWLGNTTSFSYDPDGNLSQERRPDGSTATLTYDHGDRLADILDVGPNATIFDLPYSRDNEGHVIQESGTGTSPSITQQHSYDPAGRLLNTSTPAPVTDVQSRGYTYDAADNVKSIATGGVPLTTLTYDRANELTSVTTGISSTTYTSDPRGDRMRSVDSLGQTKTYSYDQANRLTGFAGPPLTTANGQIGTNVELAYTYDADGLRADFQWDRASGELPIVVGDSLAWYITGPNGLPIEQIAAGDTPLYYHADQLGSTRALTDQAGRVLVTYRYDAYGNTAASITSVVNPFQFAGQYTDLTSGLIYMRARWYDPKTGQFISRDPLEFETRQPYAYANDDPLNEVDPSGLAAYHYAFDLGSLGSPEELAAYTRANCSALFPIAGCVDNFEVGDKMHLHRSAFFYTQSFPVQVINETSTSFEFKALNGHPEGNGRTITFSFCEGDNGHTRLNIDTSSDGSILTNWFGIRQVDFFVAHRTWSSFASNIKANYDYMMMDGHQQPEVV